MLLYVCVGTLGGLLMEKVIVHAGETVLEDKLSPL